MRQDFSTTYGGSIGSIFQPWETGYYIRAPREAMSEKNISRYCPFKWGLNLAYITVHLHLSLFSAVCAVGGACLAFLNLLKRAARRYMGRSHITECRQAGNCPGIIALDYISFPPERGRGAEPTRIFAANALPSIRSAEVLYWKRTTLFCCRLKWPHLIFHVS